MRLISLICALLVFFMVIGCSPSSKESKPNKATQSSHTKKDNPELLSVDGKLFPLSTYFGVCMRNPDVLRSTFSNGMLSSHYPTYAEIVGVGGNLKITVGKFGMYPGAVLKDIAATSPRRRIQIGRDRLHSFVLVSDFGAGRNLVSIDYNEKDIYAEPEAIRIANNVVACHLSARP